MDIESRLSATSLGDILGRLLRAQFSGCLSLRESGRQHRIYLEAGRPLFVDSCVEAQKLGEILLGPVGSSALARAIDRCLLNPGGMLLGQALIRAGWLSQSQLLSALYLQSEQRLNLLFCLKEAELRVTLDRAAMPGGARLLDPKLYLAQRARGVRRAPSRQSARETHVADPRTRTALQSNSAAAGALATLGLAGEQVTRDDVRRAFRKLAADIHPDRVVGQTGANNLRGVHLRTARLAELSAAYHTLVG